MPAGADLAAGLSEPTVAVYAESERIMLARVAARLGRGLTSPSWAEQKLAEIQALRNELNVYMTRTVDEADAAVKTAIGEAYRLGTTEAVNDLAVGGVAALAATNTRTVGVLVADLQRKLGSTHLRVLRTAEDTYRQTVAEVSTQIAAGTQTRREATQAALNRFADQGVTGFRDVTGRAWNLTSYTEMATRTAVGHASIDGHLETLTANRHNLVIVSNAPGECQICRPFEGKVLAIDPTGKFGQVYFTVEEARDQGLFHPGCRHSTGAYFEGITEPFGQTADPEGDAARQRLRYLERQVRAAKNREAVALNPEAATLARARVKVAQAAIRQHVDETGLLRQRHREQISGPARAAAAPAPPKPVERPLPAWVRSSHSAATEAFQRDGGFIPLLDENGRHKADAWTVPGKPETGWIRASGEPSARAYAHLDHVKAVGKDVEAEVNRRTGGYFAKQDRLREGYETLKAKTERAFKAQSVAGKAARKAADTGDEMRRHAAFLKLNAASAHYAQLRKEQTDYLNKFADLRAKHPTAEIRATLAEIRPMGGELNVKITDTYLKRGYREEINRLNDGAKNYPAAWVQRSNTHAAPLRLSDGSENPAIAGRGYYSHHGDAGGNARIVINSTRTNPAHELGHRMESTDPTYNVTKSEWAFWHQRTSAEETRPLKQLEPGSGYSEQERGRKDKFSDVYMGKDYGEGPKATREVLTMGMEHLDGGVYFLDPDYRQWLFGTLAML